jgi:hypothetical protein
MITSKILMPTTKARAMVAAVAVGILLCAFAQLADAAAIKTPVGTLPGTITEAPPVQTDYGCRCGRGGYGYGSYGRYGGYRRGRYRG